MVLAWRVVRVRAPRVPELFPGVTLTNAFEPFAVRFIPARHFVYRRMRSGRRPLATYVLEDPGKGHFMTQSLDNDRARSPVRSLPATATTARTSIVRVGPRAAAGRLGRALLSGRIDATTGNSVLHELLHAAVPGEVLRADLAAVDHIDAAGLEILATARRQARMIGGELVLAAVPEHLCPLLGDFTTEDDLPQS